MAPTSTEGEVGSDETRQGVATNGATHTDTDCVPPALHLLPTTAQHLLQQFLHARARPLEDIKRR